MELINLRALALILVVIMIELMKNLIAELASKRFFVF
jgi:hypothetical protein